MTTSDENSTQPGTRRGPLGDARPDHDQPDPRSTGGQTPEAVEDRPMVSTVTPEDYPEKDRNTARPEGGG